MHQPSCEHVQAAITSSFVTKEHRVIFVCVGPLTPNAALFSTQRQPTKVLRFACRLNKRVAASKVSFRRGVLHRYNQLLRIEEELGAENVPYAGEGFRTPLWMNK